MIKIIYIANKKAARIKDKFGNIPWKYNDKYTILDNRFAELAWMKLIEKDSGTCTQAPVNETEPVMKVGLQLL